MIFGQSEKRMWEVLTGARLRFCLTMLLRESFRTLSGQKWQSYDVVRFGRGGRRKDLCRDADAVALLKQIVLLHRLFFGTLSDTDNNPAPHTHFLSRSVHWTCIRCPEQRAFQQPSFMAPRCQPLNKTDSQHSTEHYPPFTATVPLLNDYH